MLNSLANFVLYSCAADTTPRRRNIRSYGRFLEYLLGLSNRVVVPFNRRELDPDPCPEPDTEFSQPDPDSDPDLALVIYST